MANYRYTIEGKVVTRTWTDGKVEKFDTTKLPDNVVREYLVPLAVKERLGTGGILASNTDQPANVQRDMSAKEWKALCAGTIPSGGGSKWIPPTQDQLQKALVSLFGEDTDEEAIAERVKAAHPATTKDEKEAKKRRTKLKQDIMASEDFRKALKATGYTPPQPKQKTSDLLTPIK